MILCGVLILVLLSYLFHLVTISRLLNPKKRNNMGVASCLAKRQKAKKRNGVLGGLMIVVALITLGSSYYLLFTKEEVSVSIKQEKKQTTKQSTSSSTSSSQSSEKETKETKETKESSKKVETPTTETSQGSAKAEETAKQAEAKKIEESKQAEEAQQREEEEGDGLPISLEGSFETNEQGIAKVSGKAQKGIKTISVTNSINDQERQVEVKNDGSFSFDYELTNPMEMVLLFLCDASQVGNIPQEDRQQASISANGDYMMAYQAQQDAQNEQGYD